MISANRNRKGVFVTELLDVSNTLLHFSRVTLSQLRILVSGMYAAASLVDQTIHYTSVKLASRLVRHKIDYLSAIHV